MLISKALQATTSSQLALQGLPGTETVALQNHDVANSICLTFGGDPAIISTPNGMVVKAGEFGELKGKAGDFAGIMNIISETASVNCTLFYT